MITMTEAAADKIKEILNVEGLPDHALRITASGGGCCGPSYEIMIDEKAGDGDVVVEKNDARLFVDEETSKKLDGAELGYISDERGEGFVVSFPNGAPAVGSCGCGGEDSAAKNSGGGCGSGGCSCG